MIELSSPLLWKYELQHMHKFSVDLFAQLKLSEQIQ